MSVAEILFIVAGLLLGLAFRGGPFLFLIPFAIVAFVLAWLNRPRLAGPSGQNTTGTIPVITIGSRSTANNPVVSPDIISANRNVANMANEPMSALKVNQVWARANADINRAMTDMLGSLKILIPGVNTAIVFTQVTPSEWGVRNYVNDKEMSVNPSARITENSSLLSHMFKPNVSRILEGDLPNGKVLSFYLDNPPIKSVAAVPVLDYAGNRIGILAVDSTQANAFTDKTAQALSFMAKVLSMVEYKGFYSAQNHIVQQKYSSLYNYQRKFFQTMTVKDIYKQIINYVKDNVAYDRLTILALNKVNENAGRVIYCDGVDSNQFTEKRFTLSDKGIFVLALLRNRHIERSFTTEYIPRLNDNEKRNMNLRQLLVMPVATENDAPTADMAICLESCSNHPYSDHEKELLKAFAGVAGFAYDRARQFEHGRELAMHDGLTGLVNRRALDEKLRSEKVRADRNKNKYNIGVLMMDIDHFKRVNDTYGHQTGDKVIKGVAEAISSEIRKDVDVVGRYGGEEFVVGLIDTTAEGMIETAERIRRAASKLVFDVHQAEPLKVTISIGAFLVTPDFHEMKKAVSNADQALYRAKENGRNQVVHFQLGDSVEAAKS